MAHGVELEVAECDRLYLSIARVVLDPVLVAPEPVARMQNGAVAVGGARKLVETTPGQDAEPLEMRRQVPPSLRATVSTRPMSEPPAFSVMNCVPFHCTAGSADSMRGSR